MKKILVVLMMVLSMVSFGGTLREEANSKGFPINELDVNLVWYVKSPDGRQEAVFIGVTYHGMYTSFVAAQESDIRDIAYNKLTVNNLLNRPVTHEWVDADRLFEVMLHDGGYYNGLYMKFYSIEEARSGFRKTLEANNKNTQPKKKNTSKKKKAA